MNERLDKLLQKWAERRPADSAGDRRLAESIIEKARRVRVESGRKPSTLRPAPAWTAKASYALMGAAAAALLFIALPDEVFPPAGPGTGRVLEPQGLAENAGISTAELTLHDRLLREVRYVFEGDLRWIMTSESAVDFELKVSGSQGSASGPFALFRLAVFERESEGDWKRTWSADVTGPSEEVVEVPLNGSDSIARLWLHGLPNGFLLVEGDILVSSPVPMTASFSNVFEPGTPQRILSLNRAGKEYSIYQAVHMLPGISPKGGT